MEALFVPYRLALELKKLGFNEPCFEVYDIQGFLQKEELMDKLNLEKIPAPTFYQAFKWFDENSILRGFVIPSNMKGYFDYIVLESDEPRNQNFLPYVERNEAELDCLEVLIVQQNYIESQKTK